jgi:hypothetical protein
MRLRAPVSSILTLASLAACGYRSRTTADAFVLPSPRPTSNNAALRRQQLSRTAGKTNAMAPLSAEASSGGHAPSTIISGTPPTPYDDGHRPYQITTPIYYVNDRPHIGRTCHV